MGKRHHEKVHLQKNHEKMDDFWIENELKIARKRKMKENGGLGLHDQQKIFLLGQEILNKGVQNLPKLENKPRTISPTTEATACLLANLSSYHPKTNNDNNKNTSTSNA